MKTKFTLLLLSYAILTCSFAQAQQAGYASGQGRIERFIVGDLEARSEQLPFAPRYSYAYSEGQGDGAATWIVLTEVDPPLKEFLSAKDHAEARRLWCKTEKASFVAVKLDSKWAVDLYFLCPGNGNVNTEMLSSANGLESVVVQFITKTKTQLKGTLVGGVGSCPDTTGDESVSVYCTQNSDYTFDAPILK